MKTKLFIYLIGFLLTITSIPVFFLAGNEYSKFWALMPLLMGIFILLYNRFAKVV